MNSEDLRIFGSNDEAANRKRLEARNSRRQKFDEIAKEAIDQLSLIGQKKSWNISQELVSGLADDRVTQELCNAIIAAQARANGETEAVGYPPAMAKRIVEQGFEFDLQKTADGYTLKLKAKGTFRINPN